MSDSFLVRGGAALSGSIAIGGAKNAALKLMVASLLSPGRHEIENVPNILDVEIMGRVLEHVGAAVTRTGTTLTLDVPEITAAEAPTQLAR